MGLSLDVRFPLSTGTAKVPQSNPEGVTRLDEAGFLFNTLSSEATNLQANPRVTPSWCFSWVRASFFQLYLLSCLYQRFHQTKMKRSPWMTVNHYFPIVFLSHLLVASRLNILRPRWGEEIGMIAFDRGMTGNILAMPGCWKCTETPLARKGFRRLTPAGTQRPPSRRFLTSLDMQSVNGHQKLKKAWSSIVWDLQTRGFV